MLKQDFHMHSYSSDRLTRSNTVADRGGNKNGSPGITARVNKPPGPSILRWQNRSLHYIEMRLSFTQALGSLSNSGIRSACRYFHAVQTAIHFCEYGYSERLHTPEVLHGRPVFAKCDEMLIEVKQPRHFGCLPA